MSGAKGSNSGKFVRVAGWSFALGTRERMFRHRAALHLQFAPSPTNGESASYSQSLPVTWHIYVSYNTDPSSTSKSYGMRNHIPAMPQA